MRIRGGRSTLVKALVTTCLLFVSIDQAVSAQLQKKSHRDISFGRLEKEFVLKDGRALTVIADNIGAAGVIYVQRSERFDVVQLKACVVIYQDNQNAKIGVQRIEQVVPLPEDAVTLKSGALTIDGQSTPHKIVIIHLKLPANTEVTLFADGQMLGQGIKTNVVAQKGKMLADPDDFSFQAAIMRAISTKLPPK